MRNVTYINAGAGSGKTYTLTKKLAEKLSEKDEHGKSVIMPSQVILTTFTELAAAEFREKARVQILEKGNFSAAAQMDSAAIGTVHSVALQFIKKFWYLLDYGADIKTISERDEDFYMSQSLARIVARKENKVHLDNFRRFRDYYDICGDYSHPDYLFWQKCLNDVVEKMEYYEVNEVDVSIEKSLEKQSSIQNYRLFVMDIVSEIYRFARSNQLDLGEIIDKNVDIYTVILQLEGKELTNYFGQICVRMQEQIGHKRSDATKGFVSKAIDYVHEHYADQDLSIDFICNYLGVSSAYFSTVFKKETGKTFVGFLTDYRMDKAVNMLISTDEKTYVIAEKVGYSDPNYFSYVFKKQFGISPSKYKSGKT